MGTNSIQINTISDEIINPTFDLTIDYSEIGIDGFFDDNLLKEIPIIKTLTSAIKLGIAVKHKFFIKKFMVFLKEFHTSTITEEKLEKFKNKFKEDKTYKEKIMDQLMLIIEDVDSVNKTKIISHLFSAHLELKYNWERFITLSNCVKNLQESTYIFF